MIWLSTPGSTGHLPTSKVSEMLRKLKASWIKMLRDDKNIEYQDQIYYALGNLAAKEGNITKAIENYKKSVHVKPDQ